MAPVNRGPRAWLRAHFGCRSCGAARWGRCRSASGREVALVHQDRWRQFGAVLSADEQAAVMAGEWPAVDTDARMAALHAR